MPSMMVQSAGIKRLCREMESRRRPELAPTGRVAKKFASPPHHSSLDERPVVSALPAPVPPRLPGSAAADEPTPTIKRGTHVSVRTRVGKICSTGHQTVHLVLRLDAVVVYAEEDGFLDVVYKVKFPSGDPFHPVRVSRDQVKVIEPAAPSVDTSAGSSTVSLMPPYRVARSRRAMGPETDRGREVSTTAD